MEHKFNCELCSYQTNKLSCWTQHLNTLKHTSYTVSASSHVIPKHICELCKAVFKHSSSLSRHKKVCTVKNTDTPVDKDNDMHDNRMPNLSNDTKLVDFLLWQNNVYAKLLHKHNIYA